MFSRLRLIAITLASVWASYFAYRALAVPWLEPSVKERRPLLDAETSGGSETAQELRAQRLQALLGPDAWELRDPKVLETGKGMLLLRDYETREGGQLFLTPCTLVFYPGADSTGDVQASARPLVLRSQKGALLRFDGETNLTRGQIGRLLGGTLLGPIQIFSPESKPGAGDDLEIHTRDVQLESQQVTAPHEVTFRYGPNAGSGRGLTITLGPPAASQASSLKDSRLGIGAPQKLELAHVDKLRLQARTSPELSSERLPGKAAARQPLEQLEITCQGPFRYDFRQRSGTFEDQVRVLHLNPKEPHDQLTCQWLAIHMELPDESDAGLAGVRKRTAESERLQVERVEARGSPAVLRAPSYASTAQGEILEYNFRTRRVKVLDRQKILLNYQQNEFEARSLEYKFAENGRIGQLRAMGPGIVRGALPEDPQRTFEASFQERLILQPHGGSHALSLISQAQVRFHELGEFAADNIHIWLRETAAAPGQIGSRSPTYVPDRMLAERNVRIDSWQLSAATSKAEIWIRYEDGLASATGGEPAGGSAANPLLAGREQRPQQKFDIVGELVQMQLLRQAREVVVEHLIIDGGVRFRELQPAKAGGLPLQVLGDVVQVDNANTPAAKVRVQGRPAEVSARGLVTVGENLQLNRGDGRLWIAGPGNMTLPLSLARLGSERPESAPETPAETRPTRIAWKTGLEFDGQVARFTGAVQAHGWQQSAQGEVFELSIQGPQLDVTLDQRVDFSKNKQESKPEVSRLAFRGGVAMQNHATRQGEPTSIDQMQVHDLTIEQVSGRLQGSGPGWASSLRRRATAADAGGSRSSTASSAKSELAFVRVDFDDGLIGNVRSHDAEFQGRVRTIYGPVADWDQTLAPDPLDGLKDGQLLLTSDRLSLAEMGPRSAGAEAAIEAIAAGNASVEGANFTARGARISYARIKDLMILEGDGRNDAELWRKGSTNPDAAAQQIRFWIRENRVQVDGARFINLSQLGRSFR